jgi:branched-chain amino acid aminotransferase
MNGKIVETEKATVPFFNTTLHYGAGEFEGIRCYATSKGPAVFRLKDHGPPDQTRHASLGVEIFPSPQKSFARPQKTSSRRMAIHPVISVRCFTWPAPLPSLNLDDGKAAVGIGVWEMGAYLGQETD